MDEFLYLKLANTEYTDLSGVVKKLLCFSRGQASVERGFSTNKQTIADNLSNEGLVARRVVQDHIGLVGGVFQVDIDKKI